MNLPHREAGRRGRQGFTLVELMVALALIIFIMAILSQAFVAATKTFRDLKAAGDLAERLRMVTARLHRDLSAAHFTDSRRISDPKFWANGPGGVIGPPGPPTVGGFFSIYQGQLPAGNPSNTTPAGDYINEEGAVALGTPVPFSSSPRSTRTSSHALHFTVMLGGNDLGDIFTTSSTGNSSAAFIDSSQFGPLDARFMDPRVAPLVPGGPPPSVYNYTWAEIAYFMGASIDPATGQQETANGTPLFNLYVRRRLAVLDNAHVNLIPQQAGYVNSPADYPEVSCEYDPPASTTLHFNSPTDLTVPQRRFGNPPIGSPIMPQETTFTGGPAYPTLGSTGQQGNADLLLSDVLSFEVRMLFADPNTTATSTVPLTPFTPSPTEPFMTLWDLQAVTGNVFTKGSEVPANVLVYDTWSQTTDPTFGDYSTWNTPGATQIPLWNSTTNSGPIILAIQVTIRVWDRKSQLTRQVSVVQAM